MRLGNDIVDLKIDAGIHPRFVQRILHPVEKVLYPGLSETRLVWRIWAAKEAAFKAHRQGENAVGYLIPNRWLVDLQLNKVFFGDEEYLLSFEETEDYVLAIARSEDFAFETKIHSAESELNPSQQKRVAQALREAIGLTYPPVKDEGGIPRYWHEGHVLPFTQTHHGRHIAVARGI